MKQKHPILIALFLALFSLSVTAQQSVTASGNNAIGSGGSTSYSVGQVVYTTNSGTNGNLAQGVQQPYEILTLGMDEHPEISLNFSVYPNPTTDILTLEVGNYNTDNLRYLLFDITGKVIANNKVTVSQTKIDMTGQQSALYFLKITENNKEIKTFKIIKK
ncbi:Por secretion system C-terminal sorting domain-containing protein [Flavobacterium swingsii]|uniref:Por secretion system C-terminal sorting domain-containing protein n=1 Tax=Flavobacterium swingsii TaxID=498292 RepID=A0A1I0ZZ12_9FLAO|nr:T9SS type A sorting domain-containing protein [Flavobacterium swingsii]SFB29538.1 Por secretion system C-terminal sorting domain-containing protein [Flavobacterium swingsii]